MLFILRIIANNQHVICTRIHQIHHVSERNIQRVNHLKSDQIAPIMLSRGEFWQLSFINVELSAHQHKCLLATFKPPNLRHQSFGLDSVRAIFQHLPRFILINMPRLIRKNIAARISVRENFHPALNAKKAINLTD